MRVDVVDVDEAVEDGEYGEAGGGVDVELGGDVAAIGGHGIYGDEEFLGYLLVLHAVGHAAQYLLLPVGHAVEKGVGLVIPVRLRLHFPLLELQRLLQATDGRHEHAVFYLAVGAEIGVAGDDVVERGYKHQIVLDVIMADKDILQLIELFGHTRMPYRIVGDAELLRALPLQKAVDIAEDTVVFMLHMAANPGAVIVEKLQELQHHVVDRETADGEQELAADGGKQELEEI